MNNTPELLSPAGDLDKMRFGIAYGADAVYMAGTRFGMRAAATNFDDNALREGIAYAHAHGVKCYITVNIMPSNRDLPALPAPGFFLRCLCNSRNSHCDHLNCRIGGCLYRNKVYVIFFTCFFQKFFDLVDSGFEHIFRIGNLYTDACRCFVRILHILVLYICVCFLVFCYIRADRKHCTLRCQCICSLCKCVYTDLR